MTLTDKTLPQIYTVTLLYATKRNNYAQNVYNNSDIYRNKTKIYRTENFFLIIFFKEESAEWRHDKFKELSK